MTAAPRHGVPVLAAPLVQPDRRSCGAAVLVVSRMWADAAFAARVLAGDRFADEVLATHRRITGVLGARGRVQLPWPRALGTPPWALAGALAEPLARELGGPGSGSGTSWRSVVVLPWRRREAWQAVTAAVRSGETVPLYVGSRWLPRHVVLALEVRDGALTCYEPSSGRTVSRTGADFTRARLRLGGWDVPWFAVLPA